MWKKKTEEEIAIAKIQANVIRKRIATLVGAGSALIFIFVRGRGWSSRHVSRYVPMDEMPTRIPVALIVGLLSGWLVYRYRYKRRKTMVCPTCNTTKFEDGEKHCVCGGSFEDIETMKWVEGKGN